MYVYEMLCFLLGDVVLAVCEYPSKEENHRFTLRRTGRTQGYLDLHVCQLMFVYMHVRMGDVVFAVCEYLSKEACLKVYLAGPQSVSSCAHVSWFCLYVCMYVSI
jgi:hypothetical protein